MLKKYIKSKQKYVLLFILYLGIFCLVAYLYGMPVDACVYALVLCLFFASVFMLYSYLRYRQRMGELRDIRMKIQFGPEKLPPANDGCESAADANRPGRLPDRSALRRIRRY